MWRLSELFAPTQIVGDASASFCQVAVGAEQANAKSLYLLIDQDYLHARAELPQALANGVTIVVGVGERPPELAAFPQVTWVTVPDAVSTLQYLAETRRAASPAKRIAVTGSNGKTTTKDMIAHLLRLRYPRTLKSLGNYNGDLGVPLTLRRLLPDDQFLVAEVGMGDAGSVKRRAAWVLPEVAVITNIGESHLARLGSSQAIAAEKAELVRALPPHGLAVLNGDDEHCRRIGQSHPGPVVYFGLGANCDLRAEQIAQDDQGLTWQLCQGGECLPVQLPLFGRYQVYNALAAAAVALWAGISLAEIASRLANFRPGRQRGRITRLGGRILIDDAYNSNPWSVEQAALNLAEFPAPARWLVLGDLQPLLPAQSLPRHRQLGQFLSELQLQQICLIGSDIVALAPAYTGPAKLQCFSDEQALTSYLARWLPPEVVVLFKGQDDRLFASLQQELKVRLCGKDCKD